MSDIDTTPVSQLIGRTVVDPEGDKVGSVAQVYVDDDTGQPEWLAISTGLFGTKVSFVPLVDAFIQGDEVVIAHRKQVVKDAPRAEADGRLSPDEEDALYTHYGHGHGAAGTTPAPADVAKRSTGGDDAMTRSEEELDVAKRTRQAGKARLRKWVETEDVHMTVPLRREKARVVTEPITDDNVDAALSGQDITTGEHEITLSEEVIDVDKRVVPKERVRLEKDVETEEVAVDEEVRKERIDMDDRAPREH